MVNRIKLGGGWGRKELMTRDRNISDRKPTACKVRDENKRVEEPSVNSQRRVKESGSYHVTEGFQTGVT